MHDRLTSWAFQRHNKEMSVEKKKEMSVECTRKLLLEGAKLESQFLGLDQICLNLY